MQKDHESLLKYERRQRREAAANAAQERADEKHPGKFTVRIVRGQIRSTRIAR